MRSSFALIIVACLAGHAAAAQSAGDNVPIALTNPMVADISQTTVEIRSSFNGAQLLVFGARNAPGELVVALRGPEAKVVLRRKERIAGMWMHVDQRKYLDLPLFYAIASTRPLAQIAPPSVLQSLGLGISRITQDSNAKPDEIFDPALSTHLQRKHWWQAPFGNISYFGESLFKARIDLPDTLPRGDYTAEVYLFDRGKLLGVQTIPVVVYKVGLDASISDASQRDGPIYGIAAVLMALFGGWLAHRLFYRH